MEAIRICGGLALMETAYSPSAFELPPLKEFRKYTLTPRRGLLFSSTIFPEMVIVCENRGCEQ